MAGAILGRGLAIVLAGAAAMIAPAPFHAGMALAAGQAQPDVALTGKIISAFITSYPDVRSATEKLGKKYKVHESGASPAGRWQNWMAARGAWTELDGVVTVYGFENFQSWLQDTIAIAKAYAFAKNGDNMDSQMTKAVAEIKNNPQIPAAQKKMLLQQIQGSAGAIAAEKPPKANIAAVKPYLDQLAALFKE